MRDIKLLTLSDTDMSVNIYFDTFEVDSEGDVRLFRSEEQIALLNLSYSSKKFTYVETTEVMGLVKIYCYKLVEGYKKLED